MKRITGGGGGGGGSGTGTGGAGGGGGGGEGNSGSAGTVGRVSGGAPLDDQCKHGAAANEGLREKWARLRFRLNRTLAEARSSARL